MTYTTDGSVRGKCGHKHRTIRTALDCIRRDRSYCRQVGGYSDRSVCRSDGEELDVDDQEMLFSMTFGVEVDPVCIQPIAGSTR